MSTEPWERDIRRAHTWAHGSIVRVDVTLDLPDDLLDNPPAYDAGTVTPEPATEPVPRDDGRTVVCGKYCGCEDKDGT